MTADEQLAMLKKIMSTLEQQLDNRFELVLHDLRKPYDSTIVDIRNGFITGRKIGDCGTNHGLKIMQENGKDTDEYHYFTHMPDGRVFRSSSTYFRDDNDSIVAALCINQDITDTLRFEKLLHGINKYPSPNTQEGEIFARNITELMERYLLDAQQFVGKPVSKMKRADRIKLVSYLDERGVFKITHSGEMVCETLGISKYTLYQYLDVIRGKTSEDEKTIQGEDEDK